MCGITGILAHSKSACVGIDELAAMTGALTHRGPDESGLYLDEQVGLGHTRLSIIGLDDGVQPIHNEDESVWIVFNGEIFNYPELREDLLRKGHRFYTHTDTEVIVHLYEELGAECFSQLRGQFALALWDRTRQSLLLARDRVGIRPLHYLKQRDRLLFASEIKALLAADGVSLAWRPEGLDQLFTFWATLPGESVFEGVCEVPPGHYAEVMDGEMRLTSYWSVPFGEHRETSDVGELTEEVRERLARAVSIRLRADVPVGCYLSGGLDSTGSTALVAKAREGSVQTFGVRFDDEDYDEGSFQDEAAAFLGVAHDHIRVSYADMAESIEDVVWHAEKPMLRLGGVPLFLLSKRVHEMGFKVVLTGEGADEFFGGYNIFRECKVRAFWARQPESAWRHRLLERLYPYLFKGRTPPSALRGFFGRGLERVHEPFFSHEPRWNNTARTKTFFSKSLKDRLAGYDGRAVLTKTLPAEFHEWDNLARAQYLESALFLSGYLLSTQGDRMAMAHSLEIRLPFLDHELVEFLASVPSRLKIRGMQEKYILKRALHDLVPTSIKDRPKHPYRAPIRRTLMTGRGRELTRAYLDEVAATGLFEREKVQRLFTKMDGIAVGETDEMALAGIVTTQILHKQYIASPRRPGRVAAPTFVVDRRAASSKA